MRQLSWAAEHGMFLQSSTLKFDEGGKPFPYTAGRANQVIQRSVEKAGHQREPRCL